VLALDSIGRKPTLKQMTDGTYECLLHQYKYQINAEELSGLRRGYYGNGDVKHATLVGAADV
jgi:hypothetical protein